MTLNWSRNWFPVDIWMINHAFTALGSVNLKLEKWIVLPQDLA